MITIEFSPVCVTIVTSHIGKEEVQIAVLQRIELDTCEVAAYIGGECRGATRADDGLYYLLVAGEGSGQPMEIRAAIGGEILTLCTTLTYTSDGSIGTPWEPLVIDINNPSGIQTVNASGYVPGVWYTLQGISLGTARPTHPGVYIFNGQKVVVRSRKVTVDN